MSQSPQPDQHPSRNTGIAYITRFSVNSPKKSETGLSQAAQNISKTLTNLGAQIHHVGGLSDKPFPILPHFGVKRRLHSLMGNKTYYFWMEPLILRHYANQVEQKLNRIDYDIALTTENILPVAELNLSKPLVLWLDATLASLTGFYPYMSDLCQENKRHIQNAEQKTLEKASLVMFTSDWAAEEAIRYYGIPEAKVHVVPWGPNLTCPLTATEVYANITLKPDTVCKLLFIGVNWERKGGPTILKITRMLKERGLPVKLTIVGCNPEMAEPGVTIIPFLDKNTPDGLAHLHQLLKESHFFVLPTMADCSPHVLIEANSFGLPCLASRVGGISTIIQDDVNGKSFALQHNEKDYCDFIFENWQDKVTYQKLCRRAYEEYQNRLTWEVGCIAAYQKIQTLL